MSLLVGTLTFVLLHMADRGGQALGAGVVVTIVVWLLSGIGAKKSQE